MVCESRAIAVQVSIAIWLAIQRFMGDLLVNPKPDKKQKVGEVNMLGITFDNNYMYVITVF